MAEQGNSNILSLCMDIDGIVYTCAYLPAETDNSDGEIKPIIVYPDGEYPEIPAESIPSKASEALLCAGCVTLSPIHCRAWDFPLLTDSLKAVKFTARSGGTA